jgi:hypothetical protein
MTAVPIAVTTAGRSDSGPEEPFAAALVNSGAGRIDGSGPPRGYDHPPRFRP